LEVKKTWQKGNSPDSYVTRDFTVQPVHLTVSGNAEIAENGKP
jgi:hypothetical protein